MLTKTCTDIIKEAALGEDFQVTDLITDELKTNYKECIDGLPIIPKELVAYGVGMVPVFCKESSYFVEIDSLMKYMKSRKITDVKEAMENVAEANEIDFDSLSLVIESKEYMESAISEAAAISKAGNKTLLENCDLSVRLINLLKAEGINVVLTK